MDEPTVDRRAFVSSPMAGVPLLGAMLAVPSSDNKVVDDASGNVRKHGARGDGASKDTQAIQAAINGCGNRGGGTVYFPAGVYVSGSLRLQSHVRVHLDAGAVLRASEDPGDFDPCETLGFQNAADRETSFFHNALLWAEDAEQIAITGTGTIDGNRQRRGGPKPIALKRCKHVAIGGITIRNSPNYCISLPGSDYVNIDGVVIVNGFSDGIDPDCCHHVRIANCHIESWDDAIVPKTSFSLATRRSTENVTISNCILASNCNCFKLGTESGGDFRNISVSNCAMFSRSSTRPPISGISLLTVDGAILEGISISNITMTDARCPVFLRPGNRGRDSPAPRAGALRDVIVSNIVATDARWPSAVAGIPGHPIEGVTFSNFRIAVRGGGTRAQANLELPEHAEKYPSADMFEDFPAYALYCRHARDLQVSGFYVRCENPEQRPAVVCDDVERLQFDTLQAPADGSPIVDFRNVRSAVLRGCAPARGTKEFLSVRGKESARVTLLANDFAGVDKVVDLSRGGPPDAVAEIANRK